MSVNVESVHLPASLVSDFSTLRMKTFKIGQVGRLLAIFRIRDVLVYDDDDSQVKDQNEEGDLIKTLLEYMETPQYLRKSLFPFMEELRFAGILPPLRTPHHPLKGERESKGEIREAAVVGLEKGRAILNIGLSEKGIFEGEMEEGTRVTVKLGEEVGEGERMVTPVEMEKVEDYWGFEVERADSLSQSLSKENADYNIGTSRYGQNLYGAVKGIKSREAENLTVSFGGPYQGLYEICEGQAVDPDDLFDIIVNVIPQQGTATVRTEEALNATLAILNIMLEGE